MEQRLSAPQLKINEEHSWYHPGNLLISTINVIARMEHWRRQPYQRPVWAQRYLDRLEAKSADRDMWHQRKMQVKWLEIGILASENKGIIDPSRRSDLYEAQRSYHFDRARMLGERAAGVKSGSLRFSKLRVSFLEKRQATHQAKARTAATKLLALG